MNWRAVAGYALALGAMSLVFYIGHRDRGPKVIKVLPPQIEAPASPTEPRPYVPEEVQVPEAPQVPTPPRRTPKPAKKSVPLPLDAPSFVPVPSRGFLGFRRECDASGWCWTFFPWE